MKTPGITAWHALAGHEQRLDRLNLGELKVLEQLSMDASNREIARQLYATEQAVENHVLRILDKLDLANRLAAGRFARQNGLRAA
jgi:DNA-binding NarL/FixJ family response regulator